MDKATKTSKDAKINGKKICSAMFVHNPQIMLLLFMVHSLSQCKSHKSDRFYIIVWLTTSYNLRLFCHILGC